MDPSQVLEYVMNTLCRICAEKSSKLTPIFKNESLALKIYKCLPIEVNKTDHLPLNICESCFFKLDESYTLYETAYQSDQRLKKLWTILVKETMICYPDEVALPESIEKPRVESTTEGSDLLLINESQTLLGLQKENANEMGSSSVVINIPGEVMYGSIEVLDENQQLTEGVTSGGMVIGRTLASEAIHQSADSVLGNSGKETNLQSEIEEIQPKETSKLEEKNVDDSHCQQPAKIYQCQFCSRQLSTLASLSVHESTHSQDKPYLCDSCGKSFKHANNLRCHVRTHLAVKKKHVCNICNKAFLTNFFLQEHSNTHTGETPYKCAICGKEFREKVHLRQHKWTHSTEKFVCPVCGNRFNRKGNMNEHIKKFHKNNSMDKSKIVERRIPKSSLRETRNFSCPSCSCIFSNHILLKNHLKSHPEQKRFSCSLCGKKFRHSGSLTYHRRASHTGERPFQCSYCDERFSLRSVQLIHERKTHTFEHPYKCSICFRVFTNSSSLGNHLYVHSKDKMFECDECGKKFSRSSNLFVHKKLHTGDRRFACDQCGKSYIQKHDMLKHRKVHSPKRKPFFCKYCGNSFSRKKDSAKHAMCQFDFLRRNNADIYSAEKILDSVTSSLEKSAEDFFEGKEQLISESVEELSREKWSEDDSIYTEPKTLNPIPST